MYRNRLPTNREKMPLHSGSVSLLVWRYAPAGRITPYIKKESTMLPQANRSLRQCLHVVCWQGAQE
jgi:hypothetical protein